MDPQQRILLQVAYEALEDSGYTPCGSPSFSPETFGCYIGAATHDYVHNLRNDIDVYYTTSNSLFIGLRLLSNQLNYQALYRHSSVAVCRTACG